MVYARHAWEGEDEMSEKLVLRISEVAELLGVSRATAYALVARGQIPSIKFEGRGGRGLLRVPTAALRKMIDERASGGEAQ